MLYDRLAVCLILAGSISAADIAVGPGHRFIKPSQAAAAAHDGDVVAIEAGTYAGDVCAWTQDRLTIKAIGGPVRIAAGGKTFGGKGIWVLGGNGITVDGIEFSGAACPDKNGAGIRIEGDGPTIRNCSFHDNQNGILSGAGPTNDITIECCEFANNGFGDGQSHNAYIGKVRSLTFRWNYSHHAKVGHALKTRAMRNLIIGNRLMDEKTGTSSYLVDVPNGGLTILAGNQIQQGQATSNHGVMVNYGEEGGSNPSQQLFVINNTLVNDCPKDGVFINIARSAKLVRIENNIFLGGGDPFSGPVTGKGRNLVTGTSPLVDRATYDYRLLPGSTAIDAGRDPGSIDGLALLPPGQYTHPQSMIPRATVGAAPDLGACEWGLPALGAEAKKTKR